MKALVALMKRSRDTERLETMWTKGFQDLIESLKSKESVKKEEKTSQESRVLKPAEIPTRTCHFSLETFVTHLEIWQNSTVDVPINTLYQDLVKYLKINKEVKVLTKYMGKHILSVLNTREHQTEEQVTECLEKKYRRSRLEKLE